MMGFTKIKLRILIANPVKLKRLCLMDLSSVENLQRPTVIFSMSVRPSDCKNSAPSGRILYKFDI